MAIKCAHCGKETTVMTFRVRGGDESRPICDKCFKKRAERLLKELKARGRKDE